MAKVIYLKKSERRPKGDKSPLIECAPGRRQEELEQSAAGVTYRIRSDDLDSAIATFEEKGATTIYVRGATKPARKQKRPRDVVGNAVHIMKIATGEIEESETDDGKNKAAVELGRKGGQARAKSLTAKQRSEIAKKAAAKRWATKKRD